MKGSRLPGFDMVYFGSARRHVPPDGGCSILMAQVVRDVVQSKGDVKTKPGEAIVLTLTRWLCRLAFELVRFG